MLTERLAVSEEKLLQMAHNEVMDELVTVKLEAAQADFQLLEMQVSTWCVFERGLRVAEVVAAAAWCGVTASQRQHVCLYRRLAVLSLWCWHICLGEAKCSHLTAAQLLAGICKPLLIILTLQPWRCWSNLISHDTYTSADSQTCHLQGSLTQEKAKSRMLMSKLTTLETEFYAIQEDLNEYSRSVEL